MADLCANAHQLTVLRQSPKLNEFLDVAFRIQFLLGVA